MPLMLCLLRNDGVWKPAISTCFKRVFSCQAQTHYSLVKPYGNRNFENIGPCDGMLPKDPMDQWWPVNKHFCYPPMGYINGSSVMQSGSDAFDSSKFLPKVSFGLLSLPAFVCLCARPSVCVCGDHVLVRTITHHHPFKLGPPNLDQRCKRPWLRSLLFWGLTCQI